LKRLRVLMTREEIEPKKLAGATVVVIDVFMATTTLLTILENGAEGVYPVASLEEAEEAARKLGAASLLRGGEQDAERIEGYDHGPYPREYPPEIVSGKEVVFVTTNGTRAIGAASGARELLIGCLRNAPAVARYLAESGTESVYIVCAGSAGRFTVEDFLGAASIVSGMNEGGYLDDWRLNDAAWMALDFAERYGGREDEALKNSRAGRWFFDNGEEEAFEFVADLGASETVAAVEEGRLRHVVAGAPEKAS
jgi:2-phosphosulfolactate phosphatase